jgi:uncharacterized repeat protein (TIGR01451 family)
MGLAAMTLAVLAVSTATAATNAIDGADGLRVAPDVAIQKHARHHAEIGAPIRYDVLVENAGQTPVAVTDIHVVDPSASAAELVYFADRAGDADGVLEPGEKWEYRLVGGVEITLTPTTCRNVVNEAKVAPLSGERKTDNNAAVVETHIHCHQDVELTKSSDKDTYRPGETIVYSITVTNESDIALPLQNVHVSDPMLADLAPAAPVPTAIPVGGSLTYVGTKLVTDADCGRLRNRAEVVVDQELFYSDSDVPPHLLVPDPTSNSGMGSDERDHADHEVTVLCREALDLTKSADKATYAPGETIVYTIAVRNTGDLPVAVNRIHVFDPMLADLTLVASAPEKLAPGASLIYRGTRAVTTSDCGPIVNTATLGVAPYMKEYGDADDDHRKDEDTRHVKKNGKKSAKHGTKPHAPSTYGRDKAQRARKSTARQSGKLTMHRSHPKPPKPVEADSATVTVTVSCTKNVTLAKRADKATYAPGESITYTLVVTNTGYQAIPTNQITLADPSLPTLAVVGVVPAELAPGAALTFVGQRPLTVANCGNLTNTATVATPVDANPNDNTASVTVAVAGPVCAPPIVPAPIAAPPAVVVGTPPVSPVTFTPTTLLVDKTGRATARANVRVPFKITVTNSGTAVAKDVIVSDRIPEGMTVVRRPRGATIEDGVIKWAVGDLAPGASVSVGLWLRQVGKGSALRCNTATGGASNAPITQDVACTRFIKVAGVRRLPVAG